LKILLTSEQLAGCISQLAQQIKQRHASAADLVLVGIQQGGVTVANDIMEALAPLYPDEKIPYGQLDITFYRDDIRKEILAPDTMNLPFDIENKIIILVDDVLFTGRTIKAALDALFDYGRPAKVELCILADRKEHRQFPIQADYTGTTVTSEKADKVKLVNKEVVLITA
jgi:pyrimidine operon attenuation protein/uracil phosphoribosyltransferase